MADVLLHTYDEAICFKGGSRGGADGVFICGGTIRGDSIYGPGQWHWFKLYGRVMRN